MVRQPRNGWCVYCGSIGAITKDHVPPKCLFPPEARVNLITVPACPRCHDTFKLDDEYFRVALSLYPNLPEGPESEFLKEKTKQTLDHSSAKGLRAAIQNAILHLENSGTAGGTHTFLPGIDPVRIKSTARRIIVGLYGKYMGTPLPISHEITVTVLGYQKDLSAVRSPEVQEVLGLLAKHGFRREFGNVFDLRFLPTDEDNQSSLWWGQLHRSFGFLGYVVPRDA